MRESLNSKRERAAEIYDIFCGNHGGSNDEILGARISNSDLHDD